MKLMPHQVLKKLADQARNKAQYELAALNRERDELRRQRDQALEHIRSIDEQKEQAIRRTVQAGMLMMYSELISEQRQHIAHLESAIDTLHGREQALLKKWLTHDSKGKALDRIDRKFIAEANRALDRRLQAADDDRVAARLSGGLNSPAASGA